MRVDVHSETRTIHSRALAELGEEACIVALGVARDLRSGVIPPETFDMKTFCGSACCIIGHIHKRMGITLHQFRKRVSPTGFWIDAPNALINLLSGKNPSDPMLAADAVERYVYDGSETPWRA